MLPVIAGLAARTLVTKAGAGAVGRSAAFYGAQAGAAYQNAHRTPLEPHSTPALTPTGPEVQTAGVLDPTQFSQY